MAEHVYRIVSTVIRDVRFGLAGPDDPVPVPGAAVVFDSPRGAGPMGCLRAALRAGAADWVLMAACDMPGIEEHHVRDLIRRITPEVQAVVATDEDGAIHPLLACYSTEALPVIDLLIASGRRSMQALVGRLVHERVVLDARGVWNVNRREDLIPPASRGHA